MDIVRPTLDLNSPIILRTPKKKQEINIGKCPGKDQDLSIITKEN